MKLSILFIAGLFFAVNGFTQTVTDSLRTRNDKPGTPQSLRSGDQSAQSHVTIINNNGSAVNNAGEQTIITTNNATNYNVVPTTPVTLQTTPVNPGDTLSKPLSKVSNASNPIRK